MDNIETAKQEWDNVAEIVPKFGNQQQKDVEKHSNDEQNIPKTPFIDVEKAIQHCLEKSQAQPERMQIIERLKGTSWVKKVLCYPCLYSDIQLQLVQGVCETVTLAQTPFDNSDSVHFQMLLTLFRQFTGDCLDCPRYGSHWEQIGFQGNDPATDLRGVGLLGLIQPLFLVSNHEIFPFGKKVFKISQDEAQEFPFMVLSINLTRIAFDVLQDGILNSILKNQNNIWYHFNFFYAATMFHFYSTWKSGFKTIKDSGYVLKDTENECRNNSNKIIDDFSKHLLSYSAEEKELAKETWCKNI